MFESCRAHGSNQAVLVLDHGAFKWATQLPRRGGSPGTKAYKGLRGKGKQVVDNFSSTPATFVLKGNVSR